MPVKTTMSGFLAQNAAVLAKAHEEHKNDETIGDSGGEIPAGVTGIAKLTEIKFGQYKEGEVKGKWFFYAAGICVLPTMHEGLPIEGLRTSIMEPMCDTPKKKRKTVSDHVAWVYNQLRLLGVDTANLDYKDLDATIAAIKEQQPYFRFRTWKGKVQTTGEYANQDPRTNHVWNGVVDFDPENADATSIEDDTTGVVIDPPDEPAEVETEPAPVATSKPKPGGAKPGGGKPKPGGKPAPAAEPEEPDLDALAARADAGGDDAAETELTSLANAAGVTDAQISKVKDWAEVVALINSATDAANAAAGDPDTGAAASDWEPAAEEVYAYKPIDLKTKKPAAKAVEVEVTKVDKKAKTVDLKNLDNQKLVYKGIAWDKLETPT